MDDILANLANNLPKQIKKNPKEVVKRLTFVINAIINGMVADIESRKLHGLLPALTQHGGGNGEVVPYDTTLVTVAEVQGVTSLIEASINAGIEEAISKGDLDKAGTLIEMSERRQDRQQEMEERRQERLLEMEERRQDMSARQKAIDAAEANQEVARRMGNALAAAQEGEERRKNRKEKKENIVEGTRLVGGVSMAYVMAKVITIVPDLGTAIFAAAGGGAVRGLVNVYNTVFASELTNWATGIQPINGTELYSGLVEDFVSSGIGEKFIEGSNNLFILIMIMCFAMVVCCYTMINLLSNIEKLNIFPGVGVTFYSREELQTPKEQKNALQMFIKAQEAAKEAGRQALGSSAAVAFPAKSLGSSPEAKALKGPTVEEVEEEEVEGGGKNKRKRRKSRKQQKSKKSKKSHKSHKSKKQQKSRKKQRKSRKNLKFKKTRK